VGGKELAEEATSIQETDDVTLLAAVRAGDTAAFGTLYQRHEECARRLAHGIIKTPAEIDDAVAEAFAKVLDMIHRGGGPTSAFRPYLLTTVRRVCYDRLRGQRAQVPTESEDMPDPGEPFTDPAVADLEQSMVARAFQSLPERWSAVLWHTEIEGSSPAELTTIFGLTANGVAALKYRAREGLRRAYLQEHITNISRPECAPVAGRLGAFIRKALPKREAAVVDEHLGSCEDCRALYAELADIDVAMHDVIGPLILGGAAAPYLAGIHAGTAAAGAASSGAASGGSAAGSAAGGAGRWLASPLRHASRQQLLAAGAGAAGAAGVAAAAVLVLTFTGTAPPTTRHSAQAALVPASLTPQSAPHHGSRSRLLARTPGPDPGHAPSPSPHPSPSRTPPPGPHPSPSPSPTPDGGPALAATINVHPQPSSRHFSEVVFQATDTGTAATGQISASISLPAGSHTRAIGQWSRDWGCHPSASGATCQHSPLASGGKAQGVGYITITGNAACGQPVAITLSSGSATASARSPQVIQCPAAHPRQSLAPAPAPARGDCPPALAFVCKILGLFNPPFGAVKP
jgi:RNA polymerase sigma factor (sigma-70 family)